MTRCSRCGHPNEDGAVFCAGCSHFLAWSAPSAPRDEGSPPPPAPESDPAGSAQVPPTAPPRPAAEPPARAAVEELIAAIDSGSKLASSRGRDDLAARLSTARRMAEHQQTTVVVVGEFKRGKSTLVNALLQTAACPVDADIVTGLPTLVRYGERFQVLARLQQPGGTDERVEPVPAENLARLVSGQADDAPSEVLSVEIALPHRMLRSGLRLLDTPGVGGLESIHGQLSLGSLTGADGALFVTDASQELTAPELAYLATAVARCPLTALVVTKTDLHQHWRTIVDLDRRHVAGAGLDIPVIPVSSFLRLRAARLPELNQESGFPDLVSFLARDVVQRRVTDGAAQLAHQVDFVAAQLAHETDAERVVLARPGEGQAVVGRLQQAHHRAQALATPTAAWQQVLADGIQDLVADVEHDLSARLRLVVRDVRDIIDGSDPKHTWLDTQAWLRRRLAEAAVANRDLLLARAAELSDSVAQQFSLESGDGIELEFDTVGRALAELELPEASTFVMPGGRLGSVISSGRLAAVVPLMALGIALNTTLAILPPAVLLGAILGRTVFRMEGKRQLTYRQTQAKAAVSKFVDEVSFQMNKETRDGLRRTQRRLRDEFQARAASISVSTGAALEAVRRATALPADAQASRATALEDEARQLGAIREDLSALAAGASPAPAGRAPTAATGPA